MTTTKTIPPRPGMTPELVAKAVDKFIAEYSFFEDIRGELKDCYTRFSDGYDIALELYKHHNIKIDSGDVYELDALDSCVDEILIAEQKLWAEENDLRPTLPVGTTITKGVVAGVNKHGVAQYLVWDHVKSPSKHLLVNFEDAVEVQS